MDNLQPRGPPPNIEQMPVIFHDNDPARDTAPLPESKEEAPVDILPSDNGLESEWQAWRTVLGIFIIQFSMVGVNAAFGVFQSFYVAEWLPRYSSSAISWIGSVQTFFELACAPVGGKLYDAGFGQSSIIFGSFLSTFSFFMMSLVKPNQFYQLFLSQGVGIGVGLMLAYGPSLTLLSEHSSFTKRRGIAMGICTTSAPLGTILFTILLNHLFNNGTGFIHGMRIVAFISLGCSVIGNLLIGIPKSLRKKPLPSANTESTAPLLDATYLLLVLSAFLWASGTQTPNYYLQLFASQKDPNTSLVFYSFAIISVGSVFGRIVPGWMADQWGSPKVFILTLFLLGGVTAAMLGCSTNAGLIIFSLLYGYLFGTIITLYMPLVAAFAPQGQSLGRRMGWALCPVGIGFMVGPPIVGAILGSEYIWWRAIVFSTIMVIIGAGVSSVAWRIHHNKITNETLIDSSTKS
ncbi:major facilitator superfamily domain-containing protein [Mycena floridula]|nr:major facilitator superfamily domain-containing protein [Mycena floridula]